MIAPAPKVIHLSPLRARQLNQFFNKKNIVGKVDVFVRWCNKHLKGKSIRFAQWRVVNLVTRDWLCKPNGNAIDFDTESDACKQANKQNYNHKKQYPDSTNAFVAVPYELEVMAMPSLPEEE